MTKKQQHHEEFCPKCRNKIFFHIGDKVTYGGNKTHHSHPEIRDMADIYGLFLTGTQKKVRAVILNPNGAQKKHIEAAEKIAHRVMTPDEFKKEVTKVCRGRVSAKRTKPKFESRLLPGARIYLLGLTDHDEKVITKRVQKSGARITNRRTKSITAVVVDRKFLTQGIQDFYDFLGVPIYYADKIL